MARKVARQVVNILTVPERNPDCPINSPQISASLRQGRCGKAARGLEYDFK